MGRSWIVAKKDVKLLLRDKTALFWVLIFPLLIAILFGSIFGSGGGSALHVALIDQDKSKESAALADRLKSSTALTLDPEIRDLQTAKEQVRKGNLSAYVLVPSGYGHEVQTFQYEAGPALQMGIDPSHKAEAGMLEGVLAQSAYAVMTSSFSNSGDAAANIARVEASNLPSTQKQETIRFLRELGRFMKITGGNPSVGGKSAEFKGPTIESAGVSTEGAAPATPFEVTFPQALLWGLLGVISTFAISLVKEREQGTLIRLRAAPMSMGEILAGKALACFSACAGVMVLLLLVGHFLFGVRLTSPLLLGMAVGSGAFCVVGIMMLLSVLGRTEQAVSGSSWGVMIIMAMFGGGMIPVFMMPGWMQSASNLSPLKWTVLSIEGAIWRGYTFQEMLLPCFILIAIGIVTFAAGVRVLKVRS